MLEARDIGGISLMYVEDEADARQMVLRMLSLNYPKLTVHSAENGAAGLELFRREKPDIVMTDINMPVMDGIRMSREIKAISPDARIIAVTAHSDTSYLLSAIEIGVHHYVLKPLNYQELFAVIDKVLEQIALRRLVDDQHRRLVESERQLSWSQRIAHLGSWERDVTSGAMNWSAELYRICGLDPGQASSSYDAFLALFVPEDREQIEHLMADALRGQEENLCFARIRRPDGLLRIVRVEAEGVPEQGQETVMGTCLDVTELKQAEEQVRLLTEDLERRVAQRTSLLQATVSELESFSYFVSHDLRGPIARLEGFCRALLEDCGSCGNGSCREYAMRAENVVQQVKKIMDAFNSLTHYARVPLSVAPTDLSTMVRCITSDLQREEPGRTVELVVAEGVTVKGDPALLRAALEHLLKNAWKFTAKLRIARIEFGQTAGEGEVVYYVRDNGAGFNMKYADKLFKPFQTIHTPGEFPWTGTGIGLATVHSIVLRHGGRVWAEGEVDRGATFYFTLGHDPENGKYLTGEPPVHDEP